MDKQEIYQKIQNCAKELIRNHQTYTRADLAYELKSYGVEKDSYNIVILVYEAYRNFDNSDAIRQAFVDNEQSQSLIDSYKACDYSETDLDNFSQWVELRSETSNKALRKLSTITKQSLKSGNTTITTNVADVLTGTAGIQEVRAAANTTFENYTQMIDAYISAKATIKASVCDFVAIRENILSTYRKYTIFLIDAFGDSIKSVAPQLFDFDTISYLDDQYMLQQIELEYNNITNSCSVLIGEIGDNFSTNIRQSAAIYRQLGKNKMGMLVAGLNLANHYLQASEKANRLKQELIQLKAKATHDATAIKGDFERLSVVHKTLNELYLPRAIAYYRYADNVLKEELNSLLDSMYATSDLKALRTERDTMLEELHFLEQTINDNKINIDSYTTSLKQQNQLLKSRSDQYRQAKNSKPTKPFFLLNMLSFGFLGTRFNRNIYEWDMVAAPVIHNYEEIMIDIKLNTEELTFHRKELKANKNRQQELNSRIAQINKKILKQMHTNAETKSALLNHLEPLLNLLRIAKEIIESSLNNKLTAVVKISDAKDIEIPEDIKNNIKTFSDSLRTELKLEPASDIAAPTTSLAEQKLVIANSQVSQQLITTLESYLQLQALYQAGKLQQKMYNQELMQLQETFKRDIQAIEKQSTELHKTLRHINTATNHEALKSGLLELMQNNVPALTPDDIDQFLTGKKTIVI